MTGIQPVLRHSPDLDLSRFRQVLSSSGLESTPTGHPPIYISGTEPSIYFFSVGWWERRGPGEQALWIGTLQDPASAVIVTGPAGSTMPEEIEALEVAQVWIDQPISGPALKAAFRTCLLGIEARVELKHAREQLRERGRQMHEVFRVGIALSAEQNLDALHQLILTKSREMTRADAGGLYLVETQPDGKKVLVFYTGQNDSRPAPQARFVFPITRSRLSGYVAATGSTLRVDDVYLIPLTTEYRYNPDFDETIGYRSRSMVCVPMRTHSGEVVGVIQVINKKRDFGTILEDVETVNREVMPFTADDEQHLLSFASQAAVTIENRRLLEATRNLFDSFVNASINAIEAREPSSVGHAERVRRLTCGLATAINRIEEGRWRDVHFNEQQLKEMEYAALLHDVGKVGIPDRLLVKAKKLYDWKLDQIRDRFRYARKAAEARSNQLKLEAALAGAPADYQEAATPIDRELEQELRSLDEAWNVVVESNEPGEVPAERVELLERIVQRTVDVPEEGPVPLLLPGELLDLTISQGTLDDQERLEVQSHVNHSFSLLSLVRWTPDLRSIPDIAYAHHERLNGSGYPRHLSGDAILLQAHLIALADIFDGLTARDRPYKKAVPLDQALDILHREVRDGCLDPDLVDLFIRAEVYRLVMERPE